MTSIRRKTQIAPATVETIAAAAACLRAGGLVAMPTETVYGLAADATSNTAVAGIYAAKGRPAFNPLIAHVLDVAAARREGEFSPEAERLAEAFWPGPLTLVAAGCAGMPREPACARRSRHARAARARARDGPRADRGGRDAACGPFGQSLRPRQSRRPPRMFSPISTAGSTGSSTAGLTRLGLESTIVACLDAGPTLLRPGAIAREDIEAVLGMRLALGADFGKAPTAPGRLESHYAPRARVRLDARDAGRNEAALDFACALRGGAPVARLDLSPSGDLVEAAANLFAYLRALDETGAPCIAAAPVPHRGLGAAINDRLKRAAAAREA